MELAGRLRDGGLTPTALRAFEDARLDRVRQVADSEWVSLECPTATLLSKDARIDLCAASRRLGLGASRAWCCHLCDDDGGEIWQSRERLGSMCFDVAMFGGPPSGHSLFCCM